MEWSELWTRRGSIRRIYRYVKWYRKRKKYYQWLDVYDRCRWWHRRMQRQWDYRMRVYEATGVWVCHWVEYETWKGNRIRIDKEAR